MVERGVHPFFWTCRGRAHTWGARLPIQQCYSTKSDSAVSQHKGEGEPDTLTGMAGSKTMRQRERECVWSW